MAWGAIAAAVGGSIAGSALQYLGAKEQTKAYRYATDLEYGLSREQWDMAKQLMAEGKPIREALQEVAQQSVGLISEDILREPGESLLFQQALREGTKGIVSNLAPYGLVDSSVTGEAVGRLGTGLIAQEQSAIRAARFKTAGFAPDTSQVATNLYGLAGQSVGRQAGYVAGQGNIQAGLYSNVGQTLSQLPYLYNQYSQPQRTNIGGSGAIERIKNLPEGSYYTPARR